MKQTFKSLGIQDVLESRPAIAPNYMTADQLEVIMEHNTQIILPVTGDCMEKAGIEDGGWIAVDFTRMPRAPKYGNDGYSDPCLCLAVWPDQQLPTVMCKAYSGKWGAYHMVGTQYASMWKGDKLRLNVGLFAEKIYGVVFASWDRDGRLKWQRDPAEYPAELPTASTIHGENVREPVRMGDRNEKR